MRDRGEATHVYAVFKTKDGGFGFEVMSMEDVRAHAQKYSKSFGSGPWQTNFEEMAKKTVLKRTLKYAPLKSDFVRGVAQDGTVRTEISEDMFDTPAEFIDIDPETGAVIESAGDGE
jgi:recombination protein RecT